MSLIDQQLNRVKKEFPAASVQARGDGSSTIVIPDVPLPAGWNKDHTTVMFLIPVGYPAAKPDCFWADADLKLRTGAPPKSSGLQGPPWGGEPKLWFSWHIEPWNPNRDSLLTFLRAIQDRLQRPE
jgi:hypothetical protein